MWAPPMTAFDNQASASFLRNALRPVLAPVLLLGRHHRTLWARRLPTPPPLALGVGWGATLAQMPEHGVIGLWRAAPT